MIYGGPLFTLVHHRNLRLKLTVKEQNQGTKIWILRFMGPKCKLQVI